MAFGGAFGQVPQSPFGQGLSQMPFGQQNQTAQTSTGFGQSNPQQAGVNVFGQPNVQAQQFGQQQSGNQVTAQFGQQQQQSASSGKWYSIVGIVLIRLFLMMREAKLFLMRETRDFFLRVLLTRVTIYYLLRYSLSSPPYYYD